jgi:hypothetical protein
MAAGLPPEMNSCEKCVFTSIIVLFSTLVLLIIWNILFGLAAPEFWVKVPRVEGLDRSVDATAPPTFNITLRVNNEGNRFREMCGKGGRVDVAYEDVPLAYGQLPDFCVPPGVVGSVPVVAAGDGLGMPDELYERMASQRQRRDERVVLVVRVRMHGLTSRGESPLLLWCRAVLHGPPMGSICPISRAAT